MELLDVIMTTSADDKGMCPSCEKVGSVGKPCKRRVCKKRGYHYIPKEYAKGGGGGGDGDSDGDIPDPLVGKKISDWLVVDLVGSGGFGQVFLALQLPVRLKAALKLLDTKQMPSHLKRAVLEKFAGEAGALAALHHPNIVRLLQYGDYDRKPFLVMEYLPEGVTLGEETRNRIRAGRSFSLPEFREIFTQILDGVEAVHAAGIIHRDLKPENLMLQAVQGRSLHLRILDFGLAKFLEYGDTTEHSLGTPLYMAPEQLLQSELGPWTDLYPVGVMAAELLMGRNPFGESTYQQLLRKKLDPAFGPEKLLAGSELPAPLAGLLHKALARSPAERFREATAMKAALLEALETVETLPQWKELPSLAPLLKTSELQALPTSVEKETAHASPAAAREAAREAGEAREAPAASAAPVSSDDAYQRFLAREQRRLELEEERLAALAERRSAARDEADE